jgi:transcriptional regulator with XRE-family HTH domain
MDYKKTGELIARTRKECGLTQRELAEQLHISDRTVSKWERGIGFPDVSLLEPLSKSLDPSISEIVTGERSGNSNQRDMSEEEIMKAAFAILKREIAKQMRKKILMTSIAIILPFFISILFWSHIPSEIGILVGTKSPYISKLFVFTVPPIVLLVANAIHIARIDGKVNIREMSLDTSSLFPLAYAPTHTLPGKVYAVFRHGIYWIIPVISLVLAILTYVRAFYS